MFESKPASTLNSLIRLNSEKSQIINNNPFAQSKWQNDQEVQKIQGTLSELVLQKKKLNQSTDD